MYVEMSQGNSCISILNKQKCHFLFTKLENRRAEQVLSGKLGTCVTGEGVGKGYRRMNMV
jgi:hypothetical protein